MGRDIAIITGENGVVDFNIEGVAEDTGLMLLQRLYVALFTAADTDNYRDAGGGLDTYLAGANIPAAGALDALLAASCGRAVEMLDEEDRAVIQSFTGAYVYGELRFTLELTDGTTITGVIQNG